MFGAKPDMFLSCPQLFGFTSTLSGFGERFRDVQYSLEKDLSKISIFMIVNSS